MSGRALWERGGCRLSWLDFGGSGPPAVLLHGLAGHAEEWTETASWLTERMHVVALDARGHGFSERVPVDVSRAAHTKDCVDAIERLAEGPVVLIGQSLGGVTAIEVAAGRGDLVRALVLIEASPVGTTNEAEAAAAAEELAAALRAWPVPFDSEEGARSFFAARFGSELAAEAWSAGLERCDDGLRPRFDIDVMRDTLRAATRRDYWAAWKQIRSPTLLVRATRGSIDDEVVAAMTAAQPSLRVVTVEDAKHDIHLDAPLAWRTVLTRFLDQLAD
jgi:pimeloyl-ACP methyl ester carboxylesterase